MNANKSNQIGIEISYFCIYVSTRTLLFFILSLACFGFLCFCWVSYLAYPNLLGTKGLVVVAYTTYVFLYLSLLVP